uniref:Uncharacterized protein MANES_03G163400 n=1 Tax=Rhizophora mucronata TaxID=61149 RepID=A0A2P2K2X0_RHIMU
MALLRLLGALTLLSNFLWLLCWQT